MRTRTPAPLPLFDRLRPVPVIRLPNGKRCTIATYCAAFRKLKAMPATAQVAGFGHFPEAASFVLQRMREAIGERINSRDPAFAAARQGRKWSSEWQRAAARIAWNLNGRRIVTRERECPPELRARLASRLYRNDE